MTDDDEQMMQRFAKVSLTGLVGFAALFVVFGALVTMLTR
jgi:hypothetical protein